MEAETRKIRLFTDSRFKTKSEQYDKSLVAIEEASIATIKKVEQSAIEAKEAVTFRLEDFKT